GNLGLLRAVDGFDPTMGTRFSTYASNWIKQLMRRWICNGNRPIRLPNYVIALICKWNRATHDLQGKIGRVPRDEEVACSLELSQDKVRLIRRAQRIPNTTVQPRREDDEDAGPEQLPDHRTLSPDRHVAQTEQGQRTLALLQKLSPREAAVLRMRF